jgi:hypothetical protein
MGERKRASPIAMGILQVFLFLFVYPIDTDFLKC